MFKLNNEDIKITRFPDNSIKFDLPLSPKEDNELSWKFESMEELFILIGLADKLKGTKTTLSLPYMPNARMDKIQNDSEGFMLKYFVETLDNLGFEKIVVLDSHSEVYKQWAKKTEWVQDEETVKQFIEKTQEEIKLIEGEVPSLVFPDKGARNRYTELLGDSNSLYGVKERNQMTGDIISFDIVGTLPEKSILIVDDICSKGGTFFFTAKKLREKGFTGNIYLYVTHAEEAILDGDLLKRNSEIKMVYTAGTLLNEDLFKFKVIKL